MERSDSAARWVPLAVASFGMIFYTAITKAFALSADDLIYDKALSLAPTVTGQAAAFMRFRAAAVLAEVSAFASAVVSLFLLTIFLDRPRVRFHLTVLFALVLIATISNVAMPSPTTEQLSRIGCSNKSALPEGVAFCTRSAPAALSEVPPSFAELDFYQMLNVPLAAAAACIGYAAFALAIAGGERSKLVSDAHEKAIVLLIGFGAATLVFSTLLAREYTRWALSGVRPNDNVSALIDSVTFYTGATSSALLAMVWIFAIGLLTLRPGNGITSSSDYFPSRNSAIYGALSVLAPILLAIIQHLF